MRTRRPPGCSRRSASASTPPLPRGAAPALAFIAQAGVRLTAPTALAGICAWQLVMGSVLSEQFGYLGHDGLDFTSAFDGVVLAGEQLIFGAQAS